MLSPEEIPTLTDFIESKEPAEETEEMAFEKGRKPVETCHDPSEGEHLMKEGVAHSWNVAWEGPCDGFGQMEFCELGKQLHPINGDQRYTGASQKVTAKVGTVLRSINVNKDRKVCSHNPLH